MTVPIRTFLCSKHWKKDKKSRRINCMVSFIIKKGAILGKIIFTLFTVFFFNFAFAAKTTSLSEEAQGQIRALQEQNDFLLRELRLEKQQKTSQSLSDLLGLSEVSERRERRDCEDPRQSCVPNCTWRSSDGSCNTYGADFCAVDASCSPNCTWRSSNGQCNTYGPDYCGSNAVCTPNCTWRASDGSCNTYGPDVCY